MTSVTNLSVYPLVLGGIAAFSFHNYDGNFSRAWTKFSCLTMFAAYSPISLFALSGSDIICKHRLSIIVAPTLFATLAAYFSKNRTSCELRWSALLTTQLFLLFGGYTLILAGTRLPSICGLNTSEKCKRAEKFISKLSWNQVVNVLCWMYSPKGCHQLWNQVFNKDVYKSPLKALRTSSFVLRLTSDNIIPGSFSKSAGTDLNLCRSSKREPLQRLFSVGRQSNF